MEEKLFGADNTEVLWFSEITEAMVENIDDDYLEELFFLLNKAVEKICTEYGVK